MHSRGIGRWSKSEYVVVQQVADDMLTYEVRDDGGNVKIIHRNRLFLLATPLGAHKSLSEDTIARSTLPELTPLNWEKEVPEGNLDEAVTLCLASHVPLGRIDGVLWPLPSTALRPMLRGLGAGDGAWSLSNKEVH